MKKLFWILFILFAIIVGFYPLLYGVIDREFGLLGTKSSYLLNDKWWNIFFYLHIGFGGFSLLIGWIQFSSNFRKKYIHLHRKIGVAYALSVLISGFSGFYVAQFSTGGLMSALGFVTLGLLWICSTIMGYVSITKGDLQKHFNWMTISYASTFSAVSLRIWLPVLILIFGEFLFAYKLVAWICWVPNLIIAFLFIKRRNSTHNSQKKILE